MSDLICRKTMMRCQTPGMCSPYGGCQPQPVTESVFKTDYARLEQECERWKETAAGLDRQNDAIADEVAAALKQVEGLRADLRFLAEYIAAESAGHPLPNYLAIGRFPVDVARAALSAKP